MTRDLLVHMVGELHKLLGYVRELLEIPVTSDLASEIRNIWRHVKGIVSSVERLLELHVKELQAERA